MWNSMIILGTVYAMQDEYVGRDPERNGLAPGHPERLTGVPLTALERRLLRELRETGAAGDRPAR